MPWIHHRETLRGSLAAGVIVSLASGLAITPARAGDDGAAPIWEGVTSVFSPYIGPVLGFDVQKDPMIDYHDRGRLVLPPKVALPPPGATAGPANVDWPVDPDVKDPKKAKVEGRVPVQHSGRYVAPLVARDSKVTMSATAGQGVGDAPPCPKDAVPGSCKHSDSSNYGHPTFNYNPLTWVGLEKKPSTVLGPEPERDSLTDPPKGLRAPVEGPDTKVDN